MVFVCITATCGPAYKSLWVPDLTSRFVHVNHRVILCLKNGVISIRIASLYGSQLLSVVFACKTASFGAEFQVSIAPRLHLSLCACKTAWLASELIFSMGPSPHLWFSYSKQRIMDQKHWSLWVPALICVFCNQISEFWTRIMNVDGFQTTLVVFCM